MNDIIFNKNTNGLGRSLPGTDHKSALLFYTGATLPTGFTSNDRIKKVFSVADAEALGITDTHLGETASTATYAFSAAGAVGDVVKIVCTTIQGAVTLCNYTMVAADVVSTTTAATAIKNAINALTYVHGFTATSSTLTLTIIATPGQGLFLNTGTPYAVTITGTVAGTLTQNVVVGVASDIDILHYHVSEFFRMQPKGELWIGLYATSDVGTFASITLMQNYAQGAINQMAIYQKSTAATTAHTTTIQSVLTTLEANKKPLVVFYQGDWQGTSDWTLVSNLHLLSNPQVTMLIAQDGAGQGYTLWKATNKSIGTAGTFLGTVALSKVNESPGWVGKFQISTTEFDTLALANGDAYLSLSDGLISSLDAYGYVFLRKHPGKAGSFWNGGFTCVALSNDFCYVYNNRTMYKAIKSVRASLLDALSSPIKVNADGTLTEDTIGYFSGLCKIALDPMLRDDEVSQYAVIINPAQDVLSTSKLAVTIKIVPTGVADTIEVNIGFTLSLA